MIDRIAGYLINITAHVHSMVVILIAFLMGLYFQEIEDTKSRLKYMWYLFLIYFALEIIL